MIWRGEGPNPPQDKGLWLPPDVREKDRHYRDPRCVAPVQGEVSSEDRCIHRARTPGGFCFMHEMMEPCLHRCGYLARFDICCKCSPSSAHRETRIAAAVDLLRSEGYTVGLPPPSERRRR